MNVVGMSRGVWFHSPCQAARARGLAFVAALGWATLTFAQDPNAPLPTELTGPITDEELHLPVNAKLAQRIDLMTDDLDSPVFQERDAARRALIEIGAPAFARLRGKHAQTKALDVRLAIEEIVQIGYLNYHVYDRHGFLGVSLSPYQPDMRTKTRLPSGVRGVVVMSVVPGTGAQHAGLVKRDVITAVDHQPLTAPPSRIVGALAASIRARRPGTPMTLTVWRAGDERLVEAVVGRCPPEQIRIGRVTALPELVKRANARFPIWWDSFFKPTKVAHQEVGKP